MSKQGINTTPMLRIQAESREDYLKAIYHLSRREGGAIRSVRVAEYMGFSKPSVCRAISALKDEGYVIMDSNSLISLTEAGLYEANRICDKHRFFRNQLLSAGVDAETANAEACRMEHAISNSSFDKLTKLLASVSAL